MRKGISTVLALLLLAGAFILAKYIIDTKQRPTPKFDKIVKTAFIQNVENTTVPIIISTNGNLMAKNKIELYSEVQGVLLMNPSKEFKSGTSFQKAEIIINMNSEEFKANLLAQKSNLYNTLTAMMPDIRLDFPNEYDKWQTYLENFDIHESVQKLPETASSKEKFFVTGRGILSSFYNVRNLEVKLSKYTLRAPFKGVLTEALVNPGTLIRPGQKLGEFIDPAVYEISVAIKSEFQNLLEIGKQVELFNLEKTNSWIGKVIRINGKVDAATQTIDVFIEVRGEDLKEGQYLEVALQAKSENNAFEVPRNLLMDNSKLYVVRDSILDIANVIPVYENEHSVVVKGLADGTQLLSKPIPGAFVGMLVQVFTENNDL